MEKRIFSRMRDLFHADVDIILFDTTTVAYYGDSDKHEDLLEYGFSKIRRGDLKQIVVGVIMSKQGIPLGHEVFEGNRNDVTCFSEIINQVSGKYKLDKVIIVGDRGMVSKDNKVKRDAIYDGMFVLTTNTNQSAVSAVEAYKDLWQVELAFRQLKSELEMGPIYHWKDRRIRAHVMICFLAFVLRTVFYTGLKQRQANLSNKAFFNFLLSCSFSAELRHHERDKIEKALFLQH